MPRTPPRPPASPDGPATLAWETLPYGLVLLDEQGAVLHANPAAIEMVWRADRTIPPASCEEIFACRRPDGPCRDGCLARRSRAHGETLPEIRIDAASLGPVSAVWATFTPLDPGQGVLLHLRRARAGDRRRRSDPHWINGPELNIKVLGRIRVDSREGPLGGAWLGQRPGQILKYLITRRDRVVQAEEIAEALWPRSGRQGLSSVRHFVHALRDRLEPDRSGSGSSFIVTVRSGYAINRQRVQIDADSFSGAAAEGLRAAQRGELDDAAERLELAISLYRGDLLEDEPYTEWVLAERDRLRETACESLRTLAHIDTQRGDRPSATAHLARLAELEPFDSDVHRELLRLLLEQGRRSDALRRYHTFRVRLEREFATNPGFELADLVASSA